VSLSRHSSWASGSRIRRFSRENRPLVDHAYRNFGFENIRKHANDVLRLSQLLAPDTRIPVVERIAQDLHRFLDAIEADRSIDPKSLKINSSVGEIAERIARAYGLNRPRET